MRIPIWLMVAAGLAGSDAVASSAQKPPSTQKAAAPAHEERTSDLPMDSALVRRWADLFANIIQQFQNDQREVAGNLEGDFSTGELRLRASSAGDSDSLWVSRQFSAAQLRTMDVEETARVLYAEAKRKVGA